MNKVKMICFGYAGGSAMFYHSWFEQNENIVVVPIEIAGRGKRFGEKLGESILEIVEDIYEEVLVHIDETYCMFGHSMGTILIYEIMKKLIMEKQKMPIHIFMSGRFPPHFEVQKKISKYSDYEFQKEIEIYGGTAKEIMENNELWELFMPILRMDYKAIETYIPDNKIQSWNVNTTILCGSQDKLVNPYGYSEWNKYTKRNCKIQEFEGKHFFIHDKKEEVEHFIEKCIHNEIATIVILESFEKAI